MYSWCVAIGSSFTCLYGLHIDLRTILVVALGTELGFDLLTFTRVQQHYHYHIVGLFLVFPSSQFSHKKNEN